MMSYENMAKEEIQAYLHKLERDGVAELQLIDI